MIDKLAYAALTFQNRQTNKNLKSQLVLISVD